MGAAAPPPAPGSVYTYISGLRRALASGSDRRPGSAVLTSGPAGYCLRITPGYLDSDWFAELVDRAEELRAARDPAAEAGVLDEALQLWHGDAYAGLSGDRIELERTHLAERRLAAVERHARIAMELGDDGLITKPAGLVRSHPLHEPLHELVTQALWRAGRSAEGPARFACCGLGIANAASSRRRLQGPCLGPTSESSSKRILDSTVSPGFKPMRRRAPGSLRSACR